MELKPGKFYKIELSCEGYFSQARAKDVNIIELSEDEKKGFNYDDGINPTHLLVFYDCSCGVRKEIPGIIEKNNDEIIFAVSKQKKFKVKNLS